MKLQTEHVASSAVTLMAKQDAEIRAPFGAGTPSCLRSVPPQASVCRVWWDQAGNVIGVMSPFPERLVTPDRAQKILQAFIKWTEHFTGDDEIRAPLLLDLWLLAIWHFSKASPCGSALCQNNVLGLVDFRGRRTPKSRPLLLICSTDYVVALAF